MFACALNCTAANHVASSAEAIIAHALDVIGELGCGLSCFEAGGSQDLTGQDDIFYLTIPKSLGDRLKLGGLFSRIREGRCGAPDLFVIISATGALGKNKPKVVKL